MIKCGCGLDSIWVENVPGKGYNYCRECKVEVMSVEVDNLDLSKTGIIAVEKTFGKIVNGANAVEELHDAIWNEILEDLNYTFWADVRYSRGF